MDITISDEQLDYFNITLDDVKHLINSALAELNSYTCGAFQTYGRSVYTQTAFHVEHGNADMLMWTMSITELSTPTGEILQFEPDASFTDDTGTWYHRISNVRRDGELYTGDATANIPVSSDSDVNTLLASLVASYKKWVSGENTVTGKSIEDFSVSLSDTTNRYTTPFASWLPSWKSLLDKWTLCTQAHGVGNITLPETMPNPPYWARDGWDNGVTQGVTV